LPDQGIGHLPGIPAPGFPLYLFQRMPLQSLMLPLLKNQLHSFRFAAFLQQIFKPHVKACLPDGRPAA
jgi:hypothetical protein